MAALSGFKYLLQTPLSNTVAKQTAVPADSDFSDIGGFQSNDFEGAATAIDITNKSSGEYRQLLDKRGITTLNFTGQGILLNEQIHKDLEVNLFSQELRWFRVIREDGRKFVAKCKISNWNTASTHDGAVSFSGTFMSAGAIYIRGPGSFAYDTSSDRITAFSNLLTIFNYIPHKSADYAFASIPAQAARKAAIEATLDGQDLHSLAESTGNPNALISLAGSSALNMYAFPVLFIRNSEFLNAQGEDVRVLQILDTLDQVLYPETLKSYEINTHSHRAYYFPTALTMGETLRIKIQIG